MDELTLFAGLPPAKTRARRTPKAAASTARAPGCSSRPSESPENSDPVGSALRTFLACELAATTGYTMAWKRSATSAGRSWWVLGTPARPTAETALSLLPTARASDADRGGRGDLIQAMRGNPNKHFTMPTPRPCSGKRSRGVNQTELERSLMPTPANQSQSGGLRLEGGSAGRKRLREMGLFRTPCATDYGSNQGGAAGRVGPKRPNLKAALLATPLARDWRSGKTSEATAAKNSRPLSEQCSRGGLNGTADLLRLVEWMMGFPKRWLLDAALAVPVLPPTATRSSRSSPSLSADLSDTPKPTD
jgi:hypothetical protein